MAYGKLKVDTITYDNSGSDVDVSVSALAGAGSAAPLASPTFTGTVTIPAGASISGYATTAANTFTGANTFNGTVTLNGAFGVTDLDIIGQYKSAVTAVSALDIDLSTGNYFTKTINGNSTFTFSNPGTGAASFTLELTHTSGTVAWPLSVKWPADTPPTLTAGKTHLFIFVTDNNGARYRGAALADYVN
jgi:hypothetical protein